MTDHAHLTADEFLRLTGAGRPLGPLELIDGVPFIGGHRMLFSREQARAAAALGVALPDVVDELLSDPRLRAEIAARLADVDAG